MEYTIDDAQKAALRQYITEQANRVQMAEVTIPSAEILALNTTPKELVAAPGDGFALEFVSMVAVLDHGGTNYTTNGDLYVMTETTNTVLSDTIAGADLLLGAADGVRVCQVLSADEQLDVNEALVLQVGTGDPAAGDGVLRIRCFYRVHVTGL